MDFFPPPLRRVEIPKSGGGVRPLGMSMVADWVALLVVKQLLVAPQLVQILWRCWVLRRILSNGIACKLFNYINSELAGWLSKKYQRLWRYYRRSFRLLTRIAQPRLRSGLIATGCMDVGHGSRRSADRGFLPLTQPRAQCHEAEASLL